MSTTVSKTGTTKSKDVYVDISGARYFKSQKDGGADFTTMLVSKRGIYSWYEGSKEDNAFLLEKAGLVAHENCIPCLAHIKGSKTCKVDMKLCRCIFWMSSYMQRNVVPPKKNEMSIGKTLLAKQPKNSERAENLSKMPSQRNRTNCSF